MHLSGPSHPHVAFLRLCFFSWKKVFSLLHSMISQFHYPELIQAFQCIPYVNYSFLSLFLLMSFLQYSEMILWILSLSILLVPFGGCCTFIIHKKTSQCCMSLWYQCITVLILEKVSSHQKLIEHPVFVLLQSCSASPINHFSQSLGKMVCVHLDLLVTRKFCIKEHHFHILSHLFLFCYCENCLQYIKHKLKENRHHWVLCYIEIIKVNLSVSEQRAFGWSWLL